MRKKMNWKALLLTMTLAVTAVAASLPTAPAAVMARDAEYEEPGGGGTTGGGTTGGSTTGYSTGNSLQQSASWMSSNGGRYMHSTATLQRGGPLAGKMDVITRTKNSVKLTGFTGGVFILLRNADGAVIGVTNQQKFGVDGTWIGRYDRTDYWTWNFDPQVAAITTSIEIIQQHSAKELDDQIRSWQQTVCGNLDVLGIPKPPYGCGG